MDAEAGTVAGIATAGRAVAPADATPRPLVGRWYLWAGASAIAGTTALYFGHRSAALEERLEALNDASDRRSFDEAAGLERDGHAGGLSVRF